MNELHMISIIIVKDTWVHLQLTAASPEPNIRMSSEEFSTPGLESTD